MHWRASSIVAVAALLSSCSSSSTNPFANQTRPPSSQAVVMFASSAWSGQPGNGRELMAVDSTGKNVERLTSCAEAKDPCDVMQVSVSLDPSRVLLVRTTASAAPGAAALYFVDLARSAEQLIFPRKRVSAADWSADATYIVYASPGDSQSGIEDLYYCEPTGASDQNLTASTAARERSPRTDPLARTVVYEGMDDGGAGRIFLYATTPQALTTGPATGPALPGTPYLVGADADPAFSPLGDFVAFRRLTGIGNGGLGTWDLVTVKRDGTAAAVVAAGPLARSAPDWGANGILFVETDAASGISRLVVIQPDGSGRRVIREEEAAYGMASPRWIPGRTLPSQ
jgi:hypothetical protein